MKILINHLTRMSAGYICVAGLDLQSKKHIRPILNTQLSTNLLKYHGGPFDIGAEVEMGQLRAQPQKPEVEDHLFNPSAAKRMGYIDGKSYWKLLSTVAHDRLSNIFGPTLKKQGANQQSCGVDEGHGSASLGVLRPTSMKFFTKAGFGGGRRKIRCQLSDGSFNLDLGVTDIRLYSLKDHVTPNESLVRQIASTTQEGDEVLLSVGLTRALNSVHWLQVNNIHFKTNPIWKLGQPPF